MLITDSALQLGASHHNQERHERRESLTVWQGEREPRQISNNSSPPSLDRLSRAIQMRMEQISFSQQAVQLQPQKAALAIESSESLESATGNDSELETSLMKLLVEAFSGMKIEVITLDDVRARIGQSEQVAKDTVPQQASDVQEPVGWGMVYDFYESHYESERAHFSASGVVHTADGKEVDIALELSMSREFLSEVEVNVRAGDALKDPLVINYAGNAAELTQKKFSFDIDVDGRSEQISFVKSGSGFLALDKNNDGTINDGSELFGALSGDGFAELAAYDKDANGWIDEGDSVYDRLRIWSKDAAGNDHLAALGKRGVGAIYLGHENTPFLLKGNENETLGMVRESGLFLSEEGAVGSVQQIDLVV